jgi:hypothetical protein
MAQRLMLFYKNCTKRANNTRQTMYVKRNNEASSRSHCRAKAKSIAYSDYVSVAVVIQQAKRMRRIIQPGTFIFLHIISQMA